MDELSTARAVLDMLDTERKKVKNFILNPSKSRPKSHPFVNYSSGYPLHLMIVKITNKISRCKELIKLIQHGTPRNLQEQSRFHELRGILHEEYSRVNVNQEEIWDKKQTLSSEDWDKVVWSGDDERHEVYRDEDFPLD